MAEKCVASSGGWCVTNVALGLVLYREQVLGRGISTSLLFHQDVNAVHLEMSIYIDGTWCLVLIGTGCSWTIIDADWCWSWKNARVDIRTITGTSCVCVAVSEWSLYPWTKAILPRSMSWWCIANHWSLTCYWGSIHYKHWEASLLGQRNQWRSAMGKCLCVAISINEPDFTVTFDHWSQTWTTHQKERVAEYLIATEIWKYYERELHTWKDNVWLMPYLEERLGSFKGLIPLIAILQQKKVKVCPVMDYHKLNHHIDAFAANADVCADKVCEWRYKGSNVSLLDLKRVYPQVHTHMALWLFQTVKIDG